MVNYFQSDFSKSFGAIWKIFLDLKKYINLYLIFLFIFSTCFLLTTYWNHVRQLMEEKKELQKEISIVRQIIDLLALEVSVLKKNDFKDILKNYEYLFSIQNKIFLKSNFCVFFISNNNFVFDVFTSKSNLELINSFPGFMNEKFDVAFLQDKNRVFCVKKINYQENINISGVVISFTSPNLINFSKDKKIYFESFSPAFSLEKKACFASYFNKIDLNFCFYYFLLKIIFGIIVLCTCFFLKKYKRKIVKAYENKIKNLTQEVEFFSNNFFGASEKADKLQSLLKKEYIDEILAYSKNYPVFIQINEAECIPTFSKKIGFNVYDFFIKEFVLISDIIEATIENEFLSKDKKIKHLISVNIKKSEFYIGTHKFVQSLIYIVVNHVMEEIKESSELLILIKKKKSNLVLSLYWESCKDSKSLIPFLKKIVSKIHVHLYEKKIDVKKTLEISFPCNTPKIQERDIKCSNIIKFPPKN